LFYAGAFQRQKFAEAEAVRLRKCLTCCLLIFIAPRWADGPSGVQSTWRFNGPGSLLSKDFTCRVSLSISYITGNAAWFIFAWHQLLSHVSILHFEQPVSEKAKWGQIFSS
jgi:hypothetical protein